MSLVVCNAWESDLNSLFQFCNVLLLYDSGQFFFWRGVMPQVLHLYNGNNNFAELIVGVDRFLGLLNTASGVPFYSRLQVARLVH